MVGDVEHIPSELEFMLLAPGHVEGLRQPKVDVRVSRQADVIPRASFARISVAAILGNRLDVAAAASEEFRCCITHRGWVSYSAGASLNWGSVSHVVLDVPVRCPASVLGR